MDCRSVRGSSVYALVDTLPTPEQTSDTPSYIWKETQETVSFPSVENNRSFPHNDVINIGGLRRYSNQEGIHRHIQTK